MFLSNCKQSGFRSYSILVLCLSMVTIAVAQDRCNLTKHLEKLKDINNTVVKDHKECALYVYSVNDTRNGINTTVERHHNDKACKARDSHSYYDGKDCVCMPKYYMDDLTDMCTPCVPCCKKYNVTIQVCINQGQKIDICKRVRECSDPQKLQDLKSGTVTTTSLEVTWKLPNLGTTSWDGYEITVEPDHPVGDVPAVKIVKDPEYKIDSYSTNGLKAGETYTITVVVMNANKRSDPASVTVTLPTGNHKWSDWFNNGSNIVIVVLGTIIFVIFIYVMVRKIEKSNNDRGHALLINPEDAVDDDLLTDNTEIDHTSGDDVSPGVQEEELTPNSETHTEERANSVPASDLDTDLEDVRCEPPHPIPAQGDPVVIMREKDIDANFEVDGQPKNLY
ncbi:uncharacterized protein LOC144432968 [Glandiceps talaboti]